jgi:hypothetical protein
VSAGFIGSANVKATTGPLDGMYSWAVTAGERQRMPTVPAGISVVNEVAPVAAVAAIGLPARSRTAKVPVAANDTPYALFGSSFDVGLSSRSTPDDFVHRARFPVAATQLVGEVVGAMHVA